MMKQHSSPNADGIVRLHSARIGLAAGVIWRREQQIKRAVAALAGFDDRTLRDMGIPDRSWIERTVRYCHDC